MADRPAVYDLPPWWLAEFEQAVATRGMSNQQLVEAILPAGLASGDRDDAIKAARVTVTRFRRGRAEPGKPPQPQATMETILTFCRLLDLDPFIYIASGPAEAAALAFARKRPVAVLRMMGQLLDAAQVEPSQASHHPAGGISPSVTTEKPAPRATPARRLPAPDAEATVRGIAERVGVQYVTEQQHAVGQSDALPSDQHEGEATPGRPGGGGVRKHQGARDQRHRR